MIVKKKVNEILVTVGIGALGLILSASGFLCFYFNILSQYDHTGTIHFGAIELGSLLLFLLGSALVLVVGRRMNQFEPQVSKPEKVSSPAEAAIMTLVSELLKKSTSPENGPPPPQGPLKTEPNRRTQPHSNGIG